MFSKKLPPHVLENFSVFLMKTDFHDQTVPIFLRDIESCRCFISFSYMQVDNFLDFIFFFVHQPPSFKEERIWLPPKWWQNVSEKAASPASVSLFLKIVMYHTFSKIKSLTTKKATKI